MQHTCQYGVCSCLRGLSRWAVCCIRQNPHQSHQVEELSEVQPALMGMFKKKAKLQRSTLERQLLRRQESPESVTEISKAESDIQVVTEKLLEVITLWKWEELSNLQCLKAETSVKETEIQEKINVLIKENLDTGTLLKMLKAFQEGDEGTNKNTLTTVYNYTTKCQALVDRVQSVLHDKSYFSSQVLKQESFIKSTDHDFSGCREDQRSNSGDTSRSSGPDRPSVDKPLMYHVILTCSFVILPLLLLFFIYSISPAEHHHHMYNINIYVLYPCKVVVMVATAVAAILFLDLRVVYRVLLHGMYASRNDFVKGLYSVTIAVTYACNILNVLPHHGIMFVSYAYNFIHVLLGKLIMCVKHASKRMNVLIHQIIIYAMNACKAVIVNVPLDRESLYVILVCSAVIVSLVLISWRVLTIPSDQYFMYQASFYVIYACKVVIVNVPLTFCLFLIDRKWFDRELLLDRDFFSDLLSVGLNLSFISLFTHCMAYLLTVILLSLLSSYIDTGPSDIMFYLAYSFDVVIGHIVWLVISVSLGKIERPEYDFDDLVIWVIHYSFHIITHITVSFDWYMLLQKVM